MGLSPKEVEASHDGEAQKEQDVHPCRSKHPRAYKAHKVHLEHHEQEVGNLKVGGHKTSSFASHPQKQKEEKWGQARAGGARDETTQRKSQPGRHRTSAPITPAPA